MKKLAEGHGILKLICESQAHVHSSENIVLYFQERKRSLQNWVDRERGCSRDKAQGRKWVWNGKNSLGKLLISSGNEARTISCRPEDYGH